MRTVYISMDFEYPALCVKQHITLSWKKIPFSKDYIYFVAIDYERYDSFVVKGGKLNDSEVESVRVGYERSINEARRY